MSAKLFDAVYVGPNPALSGRLFHASRPGNDPDNVNLLDLDPDTMNLILVPLDTVRGISGADARDWENLDENERLQAIELYQLGISDRSAR